MGLRSLAFGPLPKDQVQASQRLSLPGASRGPGGGPSAPDDMGDGVDARLTVGGPQREPEGFAPLLPDQYNPFEAASTGQGQGEPQADFLSGLAKSLSGLTRQAGADTGAGPATNTEADQPATASPELGFIRQGAGLGRQFSGLLGGGTEAGQTLGQLFGLIGGGTNLAIGAQTGNPYSLASGSLGTLGSAAGLAGFPAVAAGAGALSGPLGIAGGIQGLLSGKNPGTSGAQTGLGAIQTYNSLSTLFPDTFPALSSLFAGAGATGGAAAGELAAGASGLAAGGIEGATTGAAGATAAGAGAGSAIAGSAAVPLAFLMALFGGLTGGFGAKGAERVMNNIKESRGITKDMQTAFPQVAQSAVGTDWNARMQQDPEGALEQAYSTLAQAPAISRYYSTGGGKQSGGQGSGEAINMTEGFRTPGDPGAGAKYGPLTNLGYARAAASGMKLLDSMSAGDLAGRPTQFNMLSSFSPAEITGLLGLTGLLPNAPTGENYSIQRYIPQGYNLNQGTPGDDSVSPQWIPGTDRTGLSALANGIYTGAPQTDMVGERIDPEHQVEQTRRLAYLPASYYTAAPGHTEEMVRQILSTLNPSYNTGGAWDAKLNALLAGA